jgi:hypothetical protein
MLLPFPSSPDLKFLLNDIVRNSEVTPWWNQDRVPCVPEKRREKPKYSRKSISQKSHL